VAVVPVTAAALWRKALALAYRVHESGYREVIRA
jgi:hypothetical protein